MRVNVIFKVVALVFCAMFSSCNTEKEFIPKLYFGQPENEWRTTLPTLVSDSIIRVHDVLGDLEVHTGGFKYNWEVNGKTIPVVVHLNEDDIVSGPLRKITFNLATEPGQKISTKPGVTRLLSIDELAASTGTISSNVVEDLRDYLEQSYIGMPNKPFPSEIEGALVNQVSWYQNEKVYIEFALGPQMSSGSMHPYYAFGVVNIYSKSYWEEYTSYVEQEKAFLRPKSLVKIECDLEINERVDETGLSWTLPIYAISEEPLNILEKRSVHSIKGILTIEDRFGEVLFQIDNFEYTPAEPIKQKSTSKYISFKKQFRRLLTVVTLPRKDTGPLKNALMHQKSLVATYTPTAISFVDGSILK